MCIASKESSNDKRKTLSYVIFCYSPINCDSIKKLLGIRCFELSCLVGLSREKYSGRQEVMHLMFTTAARADCSDINSTQ